MCVCVGGGGGREASLITEDEIHEVCQLYRD